MIENIEGIGAVVTWIQQVICVFFDIAILIASEIDTWTKNEVNIVYLHLEGITPEIQNTECDVDIFNKAYF